MNLTLDISGDTLLTGLIGGNEVRSSFSPAMHTASFKEVGVNAVYLAYPVEIEDLGTLLAGLGKVGAGFNVTMPHKTHICQHLDELSPAAELMGAVNTVEIQGDKLIGHNTDGAGFVENVRELGFDPVGKTVTVVGAGGAGSAVLTQLALDGVAKINVFNMKDEFWDRTVERLAEISKKTGAEMTLHDLADKEAMARCVADSDLFVNATRVGMGDLADQSVLGPELMHDGLFVADTVYKPYKTKMLQCAEKRGLQIAPGLGMLLKQAALAEKIWFGTDMPMDVIAEKLF